MGIPEVCIVFRCVVCGVWLVSASSVLACSCACVCACVRVVLFVLAVRVVTHVAGMKWLDLIPGKPTA